MAQAQRAIMLLPTEPPDRDSPPLTPSPRPIPMTSVVTWEKGHVGRLDGGSWHLKGALLTAVFLTGASNQSVRLPCGSL